jgi:deoxyribodipyrimidine photolyase-related protein
MELGLILGDALFEGLPGMPADIPLLMMEDPYLASRTKHHQQKIVLFFSAMRHFEATLSERGRSVDYRKFDRSGTGLLETLSQMPGLKRLWLYHPSDGFFLDDLRKALPEVEIALLENPMFLTPQSEWDAYRKSSKRLLMGDFYIRQRKRLGILVVPGQEPFGGKWSFDEDNRKAFPKGFQDPSIAWEAPDAITADVITLVEREFSNHPGSAKDFCWPVTHAQACAWLHAFLHERLYEFGPYEDALSTRHRTAHHSLFTPMLNCGLLTPAQVIEDTVDFGQGQHVPLNSFEGFIRQVIGWREFIKWMDWEYGNQGYTVTKPGVQVEPYTRQAKEGFNFFNHQRKMNACWYQGKTGLPPLDLVIARANRYGYTHHIERLMVAGSVMLMAEIHPSQVNDWFMEMYIDSAEWVMKPNALGMSQFADGGLFATKPYISGSAYLLKMGDYKPGPWTDIWDGLYWRFIHRHQSFFAGNHRMSMMVKMMEKLNPARRQHIFAAAENWIEDVTTSP